VTVPDRLAVALADRYRIERELGAGGMATVYLAEDLKHRRKVALKVLRPELAAAMGPSRFAREIEVAARLQHPHVLPLHDSGEADGFLYYVMPYVEGESLRERLARVGELPVHDTLRILIEVVDALAYAHAQGVVHRDIKPDNIMLSGRHALVTDFGVAKAVSEATGRNSLTTVGVALGTPSYMAPEQAAADPHLDHRVDIYAIGVVGYELLTGRPPFTGRTPQEVLAAHVTQIPDPVDRHRPGLSPAITQVLMRCLAKRPADRWQSAGDLLAQLEPLATPSTGMTPTETRPFESAGSVAGRPRARLAIGGILLVLLIAAGAWFIGRAGRGGGEKPRVVVLPPRNLGPPDQAYVAEGIAEEVNNRLVGLSGIEVIGRTSAERYRETTLTPAAIAGELNADYILALRIGSTGTAPGHGIRVSAELLRAKTEAAVWSKSFEAESTTDYFRVQSEIAQGVATRMGATVAGEERTRLEAKPTTNAAAYDSYLRAQVLLSKSLKVSDFRDAANLLRQAVDLDPGFAQAWAGLSRAHTELYWFWGDRSERRLAMAREAADRAAALAPDAPETRFAWGVYFYHADLDFPKAIAEVRAAREADPGQALYHAWNGYVLRRSGHFEEALASLRRALELDPQSQVLLSDVAETLKGLGRPEEGRPAVERAIALDPTDHFARWSQIDMLIERGDLTGAGDAARQAITRIGLPQLLVERPLLLGRWAALLPPAARSQLEPFPPLRAEMYDTAGYYLARAQIEEGLNRDARASYDSAAMAYERRLKERSDEAWDHGYLGQAYAGLGRRDDALREGRRALELLPLTRDAWEGPDLLALLMETCLRFGDREGAVQAALRFIAALPGNRLLVRHEPRYQGVRDDPRVRRALS
jgi:serine/threonine-protein kinase